MSGNYNGISANVSANLPTPVGIGGVTVANPATILTSPAHGLATGDTVHIKGHGTGGARTLVNGIHVVTVVDPTHFSIPLDAGGTDAVASGAVQALTVGTYPIPSDGDNIDAAAVNPAEEEAGDRTAYLSVSTGAFKLAGMQPVGNASWQHTGALGTPWVTVAGLTATVWTSAAFSWNLDDLCVGDVVDVELTSTLDAGGVTNAAGARLEVSTFPPNTTPPADAALVGSAQGLSHTAGIAPCCLHGQLTMGVNGTCRVTLYVSGLTNGDTVTLDGDYQMTMTVWRPTGMPQ